MIDDRPLSADRVPTLTEVVELDLPPQATDAAAAADADTADAEAAALARDPDPSPAPSEGPAVDTPDEAAGDAVGTTAPAAELAAPDDAPESGPATVAEEAAPEPEPEPAHPVIAAAPPANAPSKIETPPAPAEPAVDIDAIVGQLLAELTPRIDMLLESRLREALAPALARAADGLIRDTRTTLSVAVRDLVQEAVDRALQRRADR